MSCSDLCNKSAKIPSAQIESELRNLRTTFALSKAMQEAQIADLLRENKRLADDLRALKAELRDRIEAVSTDLWALRA